MIDPGKLILIDGNAILHRAFYAIRPLHTADGQQVNAVFGFASMLLSLLNAEKPSHIAVSFDLKGKTFRHEEYKEYKATRSKAPDELYSQIPIIKNLVSVFDIPIYVKEGFEADDVLGTLATQAARDHDLLTYIVTGDMDALQLINDKISVLTPIRGFQERKLYDANAVIEKYGLTPEQITDLKGLQGDNSDNIKGVAGIGPKTATTLLKEYGTIENLYQNLEHVKGKTREKLENDQESAFFSKKLATIIRDVPLTLELPACKTHVYDLRKIEAFFNQLQFNSLNRKLRAFDSHYAEKRLEESGLQPSLF